MPSLCKGTAIAAKLVVANKRGSVKRSVMNGNNIVYINEKEQCRCGKEKSVVTICGTISTIRS